jgi:hypothetical protein
MSKTIALKLGEDKTYFNPEEGKGIRWQHKGTFNLLGIDFNLDEEDITRKNYDE